MTAVLRGDPKDNAFLIDMGMLLHNVACASKDPAVKTFQHLLQCVADTGCARAKNAGCGVVYYVFDSYREGDEGGGGGLKQNTWEKRQGTDHLARY